VVDAPLTCMIEIPKGSPNKYEYDPGLGGIKLDRFISASVVYPTDYGYILDTLAPAGDPLDAMVCVCQSRPSPGAPCSPTRSGCSR
jgi:inorganic pyrophosphatase